MKTDTLFYRLFQRSPSLFFELIGQAASDASGYEFRSVEIKQTAFRLDGVLLPIGTTHRPVYFSEVQFQKDPQLYHRFFAELFLYLDQHPTTHDWQGILIYPDRRLEPDDTRLHQVLLDSPKVRRVYLNEFSEAASLPLSLGLVKLVIEPEDTAPEQARQLVERSRHEPVSHLSRQEIVDLIETIMVYKFTSLGREEIEAMLGLGDLKQSKVYQEALAEGRQEGRQEERREIVENLLKVRFGSLDEELTNLVESVMTLPVPEFTPLLLRLSRAELLDRFGQKQS
jgi:predicted transposase/invertase (TIGR01784 family)